MSERILTLFGEEVVPEQLKAVGKSRAKKTKPKAGEEITEEQTKEENRETPTIAAPEILPEQPLAEIEEERSAQPEITPVEEPPVAEKTKKAAAKQEKALHNIPEDWNGEKQYYSIGEVADLFKVKTSHIRFWTNEFKLKVRTTRKGDRLYTPEQIKEIRAIHHLVKERGFTLTGAKAKLKSTNKIDVETIDLKKSLLQLRNKLVIIRNQI